jgi:putative ABC transport system ATP-binding protein
LYLTPPRCQSGLPHGRKGEDTILSPNTIPLGFPTLTAGENVELALDLKGQRGPAAKRRARGFLEQVGLGPKYDSFPADLSGGEKQRVAIARAVATEPQVILADEPTGALDSHNGRAVMEMLRDLAHRHGRAVVMVTHDNRVLEYGDRVVRIEDGRISSGSTETAPLNKSSVISSQFSDTALSDH